MSGLHKVGLTTWNIWASAKFYTNVLGGVIISDASYDKYFSDELYEGVFQKEILDAKIEKVHPARHAVADLSDFGKGERVRKRERT